jgi:7,8-dihydropterin-6-yl-methyl-4-(beta-D-ribofuranosyl)aminobenzene 5'-phosphate synthase
MISLTWIVNDIAGPCTQQEHGMSFWIETDDGRVLLDTGGSGDGLLHNLNALGLDPATINALVISHGHDDHTGGVLGLLPLLRPHTPLYAHPALFEQRFSHRSGTYVQRGMRVPAHILATQLDLRLDTMPREVLPGVWTTGQIVHRPYPEGRSEHHYVWQEGSYVADPYLDDISVVLLSGDSAFLLCGCCHSGLLNTIDHVRARWHEPLVGIAGGVHLTEAPVETQEHTAQALLELPALQTLWLGHCSGDAFVERMSQLMPGRYRAGRSGDSLTL